jgi:transcriptional regulator with XRE-family HTH domain
MNSRDLRRRRTAIGLSQGDLAEALGVSRQTIWDYENGKRDIPMPFQLGFGVIEAEQKRKLEADD